MEFVMSCGVHGGMEVFLGVFLIFSIVTLAILINEIAQYIHSLRNLTWKETGKKLLKDSFIQIIVIITIITICYFSLPLFREFSNIVDDPWRVPGEDYEGYKGTAFGEMFYSYVRSWESNGILAYFMCAFSVMFFLLFFLFYISYKKLLHHLLSLRSKK